MCSKVIAMIEIISERRYGQPKLAKPKPLSKLKQAFSYDLNNHCKCPVCVVDNDVYIKHRDWCSTVLHKGKEVEEYRRLHPKFVYNDCFACIILRGEAWIKFPDVLNTDCIVPTLQKILLECVNDNSRFNDSSDMRMFTDCISKAWKMKNEFGKM
jgi:hypothetical protein